MSEWKECKLSEIMELIGGGTPKTTISEYWRGNIPWLSVTDFNTGKKYCIDAEKKITERGLRESSTKILKKGQIIISARGTVGVLSVLGRDMAFNQSCYGIDARKNVTNNDFLYYLLKDNIASFHSASYGAVFDTITKETFSQIMVWLPPLPEQHSIASILSSLDDKIDLLHRQNKTLEALAETLFRQWFVEKADEGWGRGKLGDYGKIICGKTPSKKIHSYFGGNIPFIKIPDMHGKTFIFDAEDTLTEDGANSQQNKFLPPKSICVSCIATVGLVTMNALNSQTNQQINSIIPSKEIYRYFLYLKLATMKDELLAMASGGTATDNLNTGDFSNIEIIRPEDKVLDIFHHQVQPYFEKIFADQIQIRTLARLRDTLLPKLMSGEVRVEYENN
ncbi:MAG: restriction endonuclease subunit S [Candidatus Methanoperedens sp.]|nr:restriction endonuclease subunit S [Candidatus Methanoperedens sp.]